MIMKEEELLSAFIDEETSRFEAKRFCKRLLGNEGELARWSRYHVARDALRGNLPAKVDVDFASKVMAKIEQEVLPLASGGRDWRRMTLKPAAGFGLAASIAVLTVIGLQAVTTGPSSDLSKVARLSSSPAAAPRSFQQTNVEPVRLARSPATRKHSRGADLATRLNSYLVHHSEYAPTRGIMPYARVVAGYETTQ